MVAYQLEARGARNEKVLVAMHSVPRHLFVLPESVDMAYIDSALMLSHGQTISQPYILGPMTELANPSVEKRAIEIGTGSDGSSSKNFSCADFS